MKNRKKKRRNAEHKDCQMAHTLFRLRERYGIDMSSKDYREMVQMIRHGDAEFIGRQSRTRTYWVVKFNGYKILAVYRRTTRAIATVLPYEEVMSELFTEES